MEPAIGCFGLFHRDIPDQDRDRSAVSLGLLRSLIAGHDRSMVFFVGAGASSAGNSGMPLAGAIMSRLLLDALDRTGRFPKDDGGRTDSLGPVAGRLGFEITLNDLWQICRESVYGVFGALATLEARCAPNRAHAFLAYWLSTGGIVLTTNYDRLVEREWIKVASVPAVRYRMMGMDSFGTWQDDLKHGHCLFKLHGSLDDPRSCLGALEHVRTRLIGDRAELIEGIIRERPVCFVGWRGADPDIPPLLGELADRGSVAGPVFWVHYDGRHSGLRTLEGALQDVPERLSRLASDRPMLTEADAFFGELLSWLGLSQTQNPWREAEEPDFDLAVASCPRSGLARFAGIVLRRGGVFGLSSEALEAARDLASTPGERAAATQEIALLTSVSKGETARADVVALVGEAAHELEATSDLQLMLNVDFGLLSNTMLLAKTRPWVLVRLPGLFREYGRHIEELRQASVSEESVSLHVALLNLYLGRLRLGLFGWLGAGLGWVATWIVQPFEIARLEIVKAGDIHVHSSIDVLSYKALAAARLGRCDQALIDMPEIERLIKLLGDEARTLHWEEQKAELRQRCQQAGAR